MGNEVPVAGQVFYANVETAIRREPKHDSLEKELLDIDAKVIFLKVHEQNPEWYYVKSTFYDNVEGWTFGDHLTKSK